VLVKTIRPRQTHFAVILFATALVSLLAALPAFGWGVEGHRIVAAIADKYLNDKARAEVKRLLYRDQSLADVANFADSYRVYHTNTGPWHYVDIPLTATNYDAKRDCESHQGCLIEQLEIFKKQLADTTEVKSNRVFALKFVVHLVGDVHQPLHCEDSDNDRGGNSVRVTFFGEARRSATSRTYWNLHAIWDTGLIMHTGLDETNYVQTLTTNLTAATIKTLQTGTTIEWAMQSHDKAKIAYQFPANHDLDQSYYDKAKPILDDSLLKGGLRLARVLNETLGQ